MNQIYISLGSNIEREKHTRSGLDALQAAFGELQVSPVYESEAVGFDGSAFYNLVVGAQTDMQLEDICRLLKQIERDNGRVTSEKKFAPRTLDLDLLLFNDQVVDEPIVLPRAEVLYNAFVLLPLADIIPESVHPVAGKTYQALWNAFDNPSQKLWQVEFKWP
ncbi:2-amino-4-hydroxy-6-hydroxymethyldihydropteridine diphosphokinase [Paraneptunicella aestuarii]|uniref:2-amino-4-hydroxy-6- hydroxymethyldihydropteridine diphosphokinase n=1 Tax=Paraneptunicella aestuarii TaxID=2831148 RepID=UPI001E569CCC|nr:2-amino-4-hydroxy-6-hydroxymethyldihydropteridine diphosphokinase [Paraneptunicella aestuarii]UAA38045.1 2-amino-4-hydroxy-6-hydroxymethyldihydropteridine diphosphokinase [Paraneptunicella aestuarii]